MAFDKDKKCPLMKGKKCMTHDCMLFIQLQGVDPNTGQPVDEWGCSLAWLPVLLIENAKEVRQGAAATESMRNELVELGKHQNNATVLLAKTIEKASQGYVADNIKLIDNG